MTLYFDFINQKINRGHINFYLNCKRTILAILYGDDHIQYMNKLISPDICLYLDQVPKIVELTFKSNHLLELFEDVIYVMNKEEMKKVSKNRE